VTAMGEPPRRCALAASSIFDALELLFRYVEPANENRFVFGHKIREVLILTCTEVETAWRCVLEAISTKKKYSYTTKDYSSLVEPMRLKEWSVALKDYPDFGLFSPFYSWDQSRATKSLPWYFYPRAFSVSYIPYMRLLLSGVGETLRW
jgi:hypothetical protein